MKRYWYLMAIAATLLASCNKDEEETEIQGFKVLEYRPAPGQFINEGFDCQTMEEANAYAEERFNKKLYVSLGSFGGYITVKMPKEIKNRKGYDFGIIGNPFSGSSEPGIVWVSEDANGNGKADDVWYELKGSDEPERDYSLTTDRMQPEISLGKTVKEKAESSSISLNITIRCIIRTGLKRTPIH